MQKPNNDTMNIRNKGGRPKKISSPELLWELFEEYKAHTKSNPIKITDWVGGMAKEVTRKKERPLTMEGFETYCMDKGVITQLTDYFSNKNETYNEFIRVCARIKTNIRQDQIEGGMACIYNPSITQRLNNLAEKVQQAHVEQPLFPEV